MREKIKKILGEEKGAALILVTLFLTVIAASAAIVTDAGLLYYHKALVAKAADAAVLAGVQALPADEAKARALAEEYAVKNGVSQVDIDVSEDNKGLTVQTRQNVTFHFARFLGLEGSLVSAAAGARLEPAAGVRGIVPLGIQEQEMIYGETYVLKSGAGEPVDEEFHSGWLGLLALQGPGAKLYEEDLKYGFDELVQVGDVLNIQTGNISGKTYSGVQYRIDSCKHTPGCTAESYEPDCPRILFVPIISEYASKQVQVQGFAAFFVDGVAGMGNESYITGKFLHFVGAGESSPVGPDFGLYVPRLTT